MQSRALYLAVSTIHDLIQNRGSLHPVRFLNKDAGSTPSTSSDEAE